MCSICTTSYGPDRYGPQYAGRYGFQGNTPGQTPWMKNDPNCPGCRVGAFSAGEARPPMPYAQQTRAAGQTVDQRNDNTVYSPVRVKTVGYIVAPTFPPGIFVNWLAHNGWSCDRWSQMTRTQQLQFLRGTFAHGDYTWTTRGNDSYNQNFTRSLCPGFPNICLPFLTPNEVVLLRQRQGNSPLMSAGQAATPTQMQEQQLSQLLSAINTDCLRAAANPNVPHVSPAIAPPPRVPHPSGQALNGGPIPSSMAKYAQGGRPFNAQPTLGTQMPLAFPLGFLPVGAGLGYPRGQMPMSAPAPILKQVTDWFGALLGSGKQ